MHLMNIFIIYYLERNIYIYICKIAVFADNNGICFFNKQGFKDRKLYLRLIFAKFVDFMKMKKEMELILSESNKLNKSKITKKIKKKKKKEENIQEVNTNKNLINLKISISDY